MSSAYLLVSHGSRDPRQAQAISRLATLVKWRLERADELSQRNNYIRSDSSSSGTALLEPSTEVSIATATLELGKVPLAASIRQFAYQARATGYQRVKILPLFLLPGVHVREDLPREVAQARRDLGKEVEIQLQPHLGSNPGLGKLLAQQFQKLAAEGRILLSHGSRRQKANQPVAAIASQLNATAAYWSVAPSLATQVEKLVAQGKPSIAIVPYFLFPGGITEAIAQQVSQLQAQFPQQQLLLGEPLATNSSLIDIIINAL